MKSFRIKDWYTIIRRHIISMFYKFFKFGFLFLFTVFLYFIITFYIEDLHRGMEISHYYSDDIHHTWHTEIISFLVIFSILNYAFFCLIFDFVKYSYNLIIIYDDQIIMIKWSLLKHDRIEIIDSFKVVKVDAFLNWIFANILRFWNLVLELQKNEVKVFNFIPRPYEMLMIIKKQRENVLNDRRKKYIIQNEKEVNVDLVKIWM